MVSIGYAGVATTRTGAYDPGAVAPSVIRGTLTTSPVAICGTGNLAHVGTFRVKARVWPVIGTASTTDLKVRLSWKEGDGPLQSNGYASSPAGTANWGEVDLGIINIPEKTLGTQRWMGQIEAYSTTAGDTIDIDYLVLIPVAEGYGKARAPVRFETVTAFVARDEFDQTAGALTAKTLPVGGTWAGAGPATDFSVSGSGTVTRSAVSDATRRFAIAGTTTQTATLVQVDQQFTTTVQQQPGLFARYVDASNHVVFLARQDGNQTFLAIVKVVATVETILAKTTIPQQPANAFHTVRFVVDTTGRAYGWASSGVEPDLQAFDAVLATGGTLQTGKFGFFDLHVGGAACVRTFDNFYAGVPTSDAVVFSGRAAEINSQKAERQDSTGTYYGPISSYRGARFFLPPAGDENRTSRILVKARRNDIDRTVDDQIADSTTVTVHYQPRWSTVPR